MKIVRARHMGMCFGVRDAITLAESRSQEAPLTVLGELVHNDLVNARLREKGVRLETDLERVGTTTVMVTAHGASQRAMQRMEMRGHRVLEATCPLVHSAHRAVEALVKMGYHPVIIGKRDHVEVRGITEDLVDYDVVLTEEDVRGLAERPRFGVASQTTQPVERVRRLTDLIRKTFARSEVRLVDTVCRPTKDRQAAVVELAQTCDVVLVVGAPHSNNTRELDATCRRFCPNVFRIQGPDELNRQWFNPDQTVGITAGTSTPDHVVDAVEERLNAWEDWSPNGRRS